MRLHQVGPDCVAWQVMTNNLPLFSLPLQVFGVKQECGPITRTMLLTHSSSRLQFTPDQHWQIFYDLPSTFRMGTYFGTPIHTLIFRPPKIERYEICLICYIFLSCSNHYESDKKEHFLKLIFSDYPFTKKMIKIRWCSVSK